MSDVGGQSGLSPEGGSISRPPAQTAVAAAIVTRVTPPDALPRMGCAGRPQRAGAAPFRLCQEPRPPELAGAPWPTWRRFDPSSSPSANTQLVRPGDIGNRS